MLKKLSINQNLILTTLSYIFMHFDVAPSPSSTYFGTCILYTFEIMYLYFYFKYFFGRVLVLVLKILFKSILPVTDNNNNNKTTIYKAQ